MPDYGLTCGEISTVQPQNAQKPSIGVNSPILSGFADPPTLHTQPSTLKNFTVSLPPVKECGGGGWICLDWPGLAWTAAPESKCSGRARSMLPEPEPILIESRTGHAEAAAGAPLRVSVRAVKDASFGIAGVVLPRFEFGVAIDEGEAVTAAIVFGRHVRIAWGA